MKDDRARESETFPADSLFSDMQIGFSRPSSGKGESENKTTFDSFLDFIRSSSYSIHRKAERLDVYENTNRARDFFLS